MVIKNFKHKDLKRFFETESRSGIQAKHAKKLNLILDRLDASTIPKDMDFPGSDFHSLKGNYQGFYSVHVNGNWVIVFRFENHQAVDIDYLDYH